MRFVLGVFLICLGRIVGAVDYVDYVFAVDSSTRLREYQWSKSKMLFNTMFKIMDTSLKESYDPHVGVVSYNDKRHLPDMKADRLTRNYCAKLRLSLGRPNEYKQDEMTYIWFRGQASDYSDTTDAYAGIMTAVGHSQMNWRESTWERPLLKSLIVFAGAKPREGGGNQGGFHRRANDGDFDYDCDNEDYYRRDQVMKALKEHKIVLFVLTWNTYRDPFVKMVNELGRGKVMKLNSGAEPIMDILLRKLEPERPTTTTTTTTTTITTTVVTTEAPTTTETTTPEANYEVDDSASPLIDVVPDDHKGGFFDSPTDDDDDAVPEEGDRPPYWDNEIDWGTDPKIPPKPLPPNSLENDIPVLAEAGDQGQEVTPELVKTTPEAAATKVAELATKLVKQGYPSSGTISAASLGGLALLSAGGFALYKWRT